MTENTLLFMDPVIPWFQTADNFEAFLWIEQNGVVVGGSKDVALTAVPIPTGDTGADMVTWLTAALQELMGVIAPVPYTYPIPLSFSNVWGIESVPAGNVWHYRPFVAVAYGSAFNFGTMNILLANGARKIGFKINGFGTPDNISPAYKTIKGYIDAEGAVPVFLALEPKCQ